VSSTIETLERELGEAQAEREREQRAVVRAENAHEAACSARDEAWSESFAEDPEVERLTSLVYRRRRELYEAIDRLKAAEGRERRIKSRLMYVLPAERRRYLSGTVDEEFEGLLDAVREAYRHAIPDVEVAVVTERPGETLHGGRSSACTPGRFGGGSRSGPVSPPWRSGRWPVTSPTTPAGTPRASSSAARRFGRRAFAARNAS
jgi:hypothetical protein